MVSLKACGIAPWFVTFYAQTVTFLILAQPVCTGYGALHYTMFRFVAACVQAPHAQIEFTDSWVWSAGMAQQFANALPSLSGQGLQFKTPLHMSVLDDDTLAPACEIARYLPELHVSSIKLGLSLSLPAIAWPWQVSGRCSSDDTVHLAVYITCGASP